MGVAMAWCVACGSAESTGGGSGGMQAALGGAPISTAGGLAGTQSTAAESGGAGASPAGGAGASSTGGAGASSTGGAGASSTGGAGGAGAGGAGAAGGETCQGKLLSNFPWQCFDSRTLKQPHEGVPTDCTFPISARIGPEVDVRLLTILYRAGTGWFQLPYVSSADDCDSGGWLLNFDDQGVATSVSACACSCAAFAEDSEITLLTRCP